MRHSPKIDEQMKDGAAWNLQTSEDRVLSLVGGWGLEKRSYLLKTHMPGKRQPWGWNPLSDTHFTAPSPVTKWPVNIQGGCISSAVLKPRTSLGGRWSLMLFLSQSLQVLDDPQTWCAKQLEALPSHKFLDSSLSEPLLDQCCPVKLPIMIHWVGQKVRLNFPIRSYGKPIRTFWPTQ